jgi:hypothetical protein
MKLKLIESNPVARFYYKGNHTHPVRRTVLLVEATEDHIRGYELREGNAVRNGSEAPFKTYLRSNIAKCSSLRSDNPLKKKGNKSTLVRKNLMDVIIAGA